MRRFLCLAAAVLVLNSAGAMAQAAAQQAAPAAAAGKPSFAGKWTLIADPNAPAPAMGGRGGGNMMAGLGADATILQDDKSVTITRTMQMGEFKSVYNFDGSESSNTLAIGTNSIPLTAKAKWDGAKLMTTTTASFNGQSFDITMNMSLDATGNLVIESTTPSMNGGDPMPMTTKYKKG